MGTTPGRVLVIDDEESFCLMMADFLDGRGHSVQTARDGLEGFRLATRERFDLVLVDINMPGVNGVETLRSLQMVDNPAKLIVISGYVTEETATQCREAGCAEILNKPVELNRLGELIERLLGAGSPQVD